MLIGSSWSLVRCSDARPRRQASGRTIKAAEVGSAGLRPVVTCSPVLFSSGRSPLLLLLLVLMLLPLSSCNRAFSSSSSSDNDDNDYYGRQDTNSLWAPTNLEEQQEELNSLPLPSQSRERRSYLAASQPQPAQQQQPPPLATSFGSGSGSPLASAWKNTAPLAPVGAVVRPGPALINRQVQQQLSGNDSSSVSGLLQALDLQAAPTATTIPLTLTLTPTTTTTTTTNNANDTTTDFPNPNINNAGHEITKILKKFFQHGYDKRVRPNYSGPPALVNVSFHIIGISSVSEVQMDFTTDFYFRQKWFDPRLEFKPVGQIDELCVGAEFAERIWLPDTFFANEKTANFHKATTENTFIRVGHNGRVYRSIRLTVTCSCPMDLQYFPMDRQRCKIEIESYGYNTRDIDYRWEKGNESVSLDGKIELPQFKVLGFKMGHELQSLSSGDYIRLYCEIHFVRSMGYYLIQIYIPASLIVIISWVSFWLHRNATPARVALGVTTVLTMTTLMSSTNAALPKISYIKSIDVFLGTCFVMVFASLLEYASVGYIGKRIAMKRKRQQDLKQMQQHHQKVCVAAAASAAAAAVAAQQQNPAGVAPAFVKQQLFVSDQQFLAATAPSSSAAAAAAAGLQQTAKPHSQQTLTRRTIPQQQEGMIQVAGAGQQQQQQQQPILVRRQFKASNSQGEPPSYCTTTAAAFGQRSTIKITPEPQHYLHQQTSLEQSHTTIAKPPAAAAAASSGAIVPPQAEFESQAGASGGGGASGGKQEDVVRICGLTPSAIDKYSRVVFPLCFFTFNLMYWIIYRHISQQIDDRGPPLIPFVRS